MRNISAAKLDELARKLALLSGEKYEDSLREVLSLYLVKFHAS